MTVVLCGHLYKALYENTEIFVLKQYFYYWKTLCAVLEILAFI